jgi:lysophospholipase L1-like esterase
MSLDSSPHSATHTRDSAAVLTKISRVGMSRFIVAFAMIALSPGARTRASEPQKPATNVISIDHADLQLAPYVWKQSGKGKGARAEAAMPGAYLKAAFRGSTSVGLVVDGSINRGCPASSMPVVEFSVDESPFKVVPLVNTEASFTVPVAGGLDAAASHRLDVFFRASDLTQKRWESPITHLCLAGIALDEGASLLPRPARAKRAIAFGDSITEGVGVDGLFTSWQKLGVNNARETWFPIVCAALDCEYGQLGSGGLGMTRQLNLPPLPQIWDHHDPATSRLTGGLLLPEPDYVFCSLGTNDFEKDVTADYTGWLAEVRRACPRAWVFCIVPPLGVHKREIEAAVNARRIARDARVRMIDPARLAPGFRAGKGATHLGYDGVHPSGYGHAMLGGVIAVDAQKVLSGEK